MMTQRPLTLSAMARRLGVTTAWLRGESQRGSIPCLPAGDTYLFDAEVVEQCILRRAAASASTRDDGEQAQAVGGNRDA